MWRSATIHGRSASGSAGCGRSAGAACQARRRARRAAPRRRRTTALGVAPSARRLLALAQLVVLGESRRGGRCELGLLRRRRPGAAIAQPAACASSSTRGSPSTPGTKIAVLGRGSPRARRRRVRCAPRRGRRGRAGSPAAPTSGRRAQQHRLPVGQLAQRAQHAARAGRSFGRSSTVIRLRFAAGSKSVERDAGRDELVVAGEALRRPRRGSAPRARAARRCRASSFSRCERAGG